MQREEQIIELDIFLDEPYAEDGEDGIHLCRDCVAPEALNIHPTPRKEAHLD